jgi:hypothetical protein
MYPMSEAEFDKWLAVLREHFPKGVLYRYFYDHPQLEELRKGLWPEWRHKWWKFWYEVSLIPRIWRELHGRR